MCLWKHTNAEIDSHDFDTLLYPVQRRIKEYVPNILHSDVTGIGPITKTNFVAMKYEKSAGIKKVPDYKFISNCPDSNVRWPNVGTVVPTLGQR